MREAQWHLLRGRGWALALAVSLAALFAWGGYAPFFNPDEGRYASAALEMARGFEGRAPDWVVPHLNGVPRLNKPPLVYWCSAAAIRLLGASEFAGRLPSMLAGAGVALLLWAWGRRAIDELTGRLAALLWLSCVFAFGFARIANTDMLLAGALTLATYGVWLALDGGSSTPEGTANETRPVLIPALVAGLGMGLALLAKGPVGAIFPLLIGFVALVCTRRLRVLASARVWIALALSLAVALLMAWPWVAAISARIPGFLHDFILKENVARYSGGVEFHKPSPPWFYLPVLLVGLLPWSAFLLAATPARSPREARALWFWAAWALVIVGVFSLSSTKLVSYVLPAFAPMSLLLGFFFAARIQGEEQEPAQVLEAAPASKMRRSRGKEMPARTQQKSQKRWRLALWISLVVQTLLVAGASFFLLSDKVVPRAEGIPVVAGAVVAQAVGVVGIIAALSKSLSILKTKRTGTPEIGNRGSETLRVFSWVWAGSLLLHLVLLFGASRVALYEDSGSPMRALSSYLLPQDRVVSLQEFQPSAIFYSGRPVFLVDFANTSGLDDASIKASKYFPSYTPGMLERWRKDKARTFVLVRDKTPFLDELSKKWTRVAITNDHMIFCNHDAPKGFSYDFVAPRKRER